MTTTLPFSDNISILGQSNSMGTQTLCNRLVIQPMEGCDGEENGSPGELTKRRYERFAKGGAGLLWFEAVSVSQEAKGNKYQLYLSNDTLDSFSRLIADIKDKGENIPIILQSTHSGRYSKPGSSFAPIIAQNIPMYEGESPLPPKCIISDDNLKHLEDEFVKAAKLAALAGFDGVDIKACHGYLINELLGAHTRPGMYGGSFENRIRFLQNVIDAVRSNVPSGFIVTTRMNIYDGIPHPYGFGTELNNSETPDMSEPIALLKKLKLDIVNITMGNPYQPPHFNRPTETKYVERMYKYTREIQQALPDLPVIASGPSFLREKSANLAAGAVEQGYCSLVGYGRMCFAYPDFAKDILADGLEKSKVCVTCSKCSQLMRAGSSTGCVVRDDVYTKKYLEIFKK